MNDVEIVGMDVKPYIHSQRNCRPSASGYIMEPINSNLEIDLSSFSDNIKVTIITKRISGNGKVKINDEDYEVLSKENNHLEIKLSNKILKFTRDNSSVGKIVIAKIKITTKDIQLESNPALLEPKTSIINPENWRILLLKSGAVKGVRYANNRLFVSEGAYIENAEAIEFLRTDPPQCFVRSNIIKFIYSCEITEISFSHGFGLSAPFPNKYKHFNAPALLQTSQQNMQDINSNHILSQNNIEPSPGSNVLYDSYVSTFNLETLTNANEVIVNQGKNASGLVLKRFGTFSIPMSELQPNMQYVVVANVKRLSGNGKFGAAIETTDGTRKSFMLVLAAEREVELFLPLNTEEAPTPGDNYLLKIFRPEDSSVGEVLIERLMVIKGISVASSYVNKSIPTTIMINDKTYLSNKNETDQIRYNAKKYSRINYFNSNDNKLDYKAEISVRSKSGMNWFNKIKSICPGLKLVNDSKILIGELGSLMPAEKIWLNAFNDATISDKDHKILQNAKHILSPSLQNTELLSKLYPNVKINLIEKPWPMITPMAMKSLPTDYMVMFHRNNHLTSAVLEAYSNNYPNLILIGASQNYDKNIIQLNEYITYDKILSVLLNSKLLIDIPECDDYYSGLLSLASSAGIPTITSNWFGLNKPNCKFIISKNKVDELNVPTTNDIINGINDGLNIQRGDSNNNHNDKLVNFLSILFS